MTLISVTPLSDGRHIRMELEKNGKRFRVVKFRTSIDDFPFKAGDNLDLAVKVSKNFYNEKNYLSIQAVDYRLSGTDDNRYFKEKNDFDVFRKTGRGSKDMYPSRDICAVIYRYLKSNNGYSYGIDNLYFRLQKSVNYSQLIFALEAFEQAGIINNGKAITLNNVGKVDLEGTRILVDLRNRLGR